MSVWVTGARPRTLGAGLVPVVVGAAAASRIVWWRFGFALLVALGLQIGVNLVNDYFDGVRGVDTVARLGPPRLVASGIASPRPVLAGALACFGVAGACGLVLALVTSPFLILAIGALALLAAFGYSGGPKPYAALGLGELSVFLFFGLMATCGTAFVMSESVPASAWWAGSALGLLAVAILVANNLRDIPTDEAAGKRTLGVRLGDARTRLLYRACIVGAYVVIVVGVLVFIASERIGITQWALFAMVSWLLAIRPVEAVGSASGRELVPVLVGTAATHAAFGLLLALGLWLSHVAA